MGERLEVVTADRPRRQAPGRLYALLERELCQAGDKSTCTLDRLAQHGFASMKANMAAYKAVSRDKKSIELRKF